MDDFLKQVRAAIDLSHGNCEEACAILRENRPIHKALATAIAEALEKARLAKGKKGAPAKWIPAIELFLVRRVQELRNQGMTKEKAFQTLGTEYHEHFADDDIANIFKSWEVKQRRKERSRK